MWRTHTCHEVGFQVNGAYKEYQGLALLHARLICDLCCQVNSAPFPNPPGTNKERANCQAADNNVCSCYTAQSQQRWQSLCIIQQPPFVAIVLVVCKEKSTPALDLMTAKHYTHLSDREERTFYSAKNMPSDTVWGTICKLLFIYKCIILSTLIPSVTFARVCVCVCVCIGCVSLILQNEAAGSLIAPWWLTAIQVINPALSM